MSRFGHVLSVAKQDPEPEETTEIVQLNLKVSPALRTALRAKALRLGIPLTEALRPLLAAWAADDT